jgi:hypothetical protein
MHSVTNSDWQFILTKTQEYLRNRIVGCGCERDQIEAWRRFYRTNEPVVRWMVSKTVCESHRDACTEDVWLGVVANLNALRSPQTYDSFQYWLKNIVRSSAQKYQGPAVARSSEAREEDREVDRQQLADLNDRLLQLRLVESQPVERVARTLGLTCEQVIDRQYVVLRQILSVLIRLDIAPAG